LVSVTYAHHSLIQGNRPGVLNGLVATIFLAVVFTICQGIEYTVSSFTLGDGSFGSCFYFGTGLMVAPIKFNLRKINRSLNKDNLSY
jgi:heme/copper-type cytochrome/quinol oxidase subunit 3